MSDETNEFGEIAAEISEEELGGDINLVSTDDDEEGVEDESIDTLVDDDFIKSDDDEEGEEDPYMEEIEEILDPNETNSYDDR